MDDAIYQKIDKLQEQSIEVYKNYYKEVDAGRKAELWQKHHLIEREVENLWEEVKAIDRLREKSANAYKNYCKEYDVIRMAELWQEFSLIEDEIDHLYDSVKD